MLRRYAVLVLVMAALALLGCGGGTSPDTGAESTPESASPVAEAPTMEPAAEPTLAATMTATPEPPAPTVAAPTATATETVPTATTEPSPAPPSATATLPPQPSPSPTEAAQPQGAGQGERPVEAIQILSPGPGSRVVSPLRVMGEANPTFEQTLVVRVVLVEGGELALAPTTIQAEIGQRGPFEIEIPFEVTGEQSAFVQVFSESAMDGAIEHLSSVGLVLMEGGTESIRPAIVGPEQITIFSPAQGDTISGGVVHVEGFGLASFEAELVADLLDVDGNTLARAPFMVQMPDVGQPGPFSVDLSYNISASGPARVVIRDPSEAFNGTGHLSSVVVTLEP